MTTKTNKYRISGSVIVPVSYSIEVEATTAEAAEVLVREQLLTNRSYRVLDFDGNSIDFGDDDIEVDEVSDS